MEMGLVFVWLAGPLAAAVVLIQSRSLPAAFFVSSVSLSGLICTICALTGGEKSFALMWLLIVPLEAALSERRWCIVHALFPVLISLAFIFFGGSMNWFDAYPVISASDPIGVLLGPVALIFYGALLTLRVQQTFRGTQIRVLANEEKYRLLAENATDLITRHGISGDVVFASPATKTLMGVSQNSLHGQGLFNNVHVADRPIYMQLISDVVARGLLLVAEFRLKTAVNRSGETACDANAIRLPNHEYSWVEMRCRPVWDDGGSVVGIVAITRDVSDRREQEDTLRETHEDLKQLSESKSRFLANMSHELRTPLNAILGFSEILEQEIFGKLQNEKQKEYVGLIRESGNHLLQVVTDILDVSKIESGTFDIIPETFEVAHLVNTCSNMMSQQAEKRGINLVSIVPDNLPEAVADPRACRQILINLISNALKFSDDGDRVTVGVRLEGQDLAYFVRDTGIGMSNEDLARVGQPFFQAENSHDRRFEGTGLGVSVVKGLAELHKGRVIFESRPGEGTSVTVFIPLDCDHDDRRVEILETRENMATNIADVARLIEANERKSA